jgi:membrane-bound lytic murein transglycosylase D
MKIAHLLLLTLAVSCGYINTKNESNGAFGDIIPGGQSTGSTGLFSLLNKQSLIDSNEVSSEDVNRWKTYFLTKSKDRFARYLANGFQYKDIVIDIFSSYGLPSELFYLGIIESGYYTKAKSHAGAQGPWQFMAATGKAYGLKVERYVDERRSIFKSTHAAAKYLKDLYNIFHSWGLALAAYNAGENRIIRLIRSANTRSFAELSRRGLLPKETAQYLPKMVAAIELGEQWRTHYEVEIRKSWHKEDFLPVKLYKTVSIKDLARATNTDLNVLKKWNQDLISPVVKASLKKPHIVYLDKSKHTSILAQRLADIKPVKVVAHYNPVGFRRHKVRRGESLYRVARKYRTSIKLLKKINNLNSTGLIKIGQVLKIPVLKTVAKSKIYKVKAGDNLLKISNKFNVPLHKLKSENGLTHSRIYPQQNLKIPNEG